MNEYLFDSIRFCFALLWFGLIRFGLVCCFGFNISISIAVRTTSESMTHPTLHRLCADIEITSDILLQAYFMFSFYYFVLFSAQHESSHFQWFYVMNLFALFSHIDRSMFVSFSSSFLLAPDRSFAGLPDQYLYCTFGVMCIELNTFHHRFVVINSNHSKIKFRSRDLTRNTHRALTFKWKFDGAIAERSHVKCIPLRVFTTWQPQTANADIDAIYAEN